MVFSQGFNGSETQACRGWTSRGVRTPAMSITRGVYPATAGQNSAGLDKTPDWSPHPPRGRFGGESRSPPSAGGFRRPAGWPRGHIPRPPHRGGRWLRGGWNRAPSTGVCPPQLRSSWGAFLANYLRPHQCRCRRPDVCLTSARQRMVLSVASLWASVKCPRRE